MFHVDFAQHVLNKIDESLGPLEQALQDGAFQEWIATREAVGRRRGLCEARAIITEALGNERA